MNLENVKRRLYKIEHAVPQPPSLEDLQAQRFHERLMRSGDANLIRIIQAVYIALDENPTATLDNLVDPAATSLRLSWPLTPFDMAQFVAYVEGDEQYEAFLATNPRASELAEQMMKAVGLGSSP
jgi:hypothetical protein